jgi:hypothetical protein
MAGPGETLGSPWPPLAICPCTWCDTQAHISWGIHGLLKVLLGAAIPYYSMPCRQPTLKRPHGLLGYVLLPPWIPHAVQAWRQSPLTSHGHGGWVAKSFLYTFSETVDAHSSSCIYRLFCDDSHHAKVALFSHWIIQIEWNL